MSLAPVRLMPFRLRLVSVLPVRSAEGPSRKPPRICQGLGRLEGDPVVPPERTQTRFDPDRFVPATFAPTKSAPDRLRPERFTPARLAFRKLAPGPARKPDRTTQLAGSAAGVPTTPPDRTPARVALVRVVPVRLAPVNVAPVRSNPVRSFPLRFAPVRFVPA